MNSVSLENRAAIAATRAVCRRQAPHLLFATYFLNRRKRQAVCALAAFISIARDALRQKTDGEACCSGGIEHVAHLFREQIDRVYARTVELPLPEFRSESQHVVYAFGQAIEQFEIPRNHLTAWLDGVIADQSTTRYATWSALERHCHLTHGSIALAVASILGVTRSDAPRLILDLAAGIRLTEILARVNADRQGNRIYLPLADLAQYRYAERDLLGGALNENLHQLMAFEIQRARSLLTDGQTLVPWLAGDGSRVAAASVLVQYRDVLAKLERRGSNLFRDPAPQPAFSLSRLPAIWRVARQQPAPISPTSSPSSA